MDVSDKYLIYKVLNWTIPTPCIYRMGVAMEGITVCIWEIAIAISVMGTSTVIGMVWEPESVMVRCGGSYASNASRG